MTPRNHPFGCPSYPDFLNQNLNALQWLATSDCPVTPRNHPFDRQSCPDFLNRSLDAPQGLVTSDCPPKLRNYSLGSGELPPTPDHGAVSFYLTHRLLSRCSLNSSLSFRHG